MKTGTAGRYINTRSRVLNIGGLLMGGSHPVRIQSMTNVDTLDTKAVTKQVTDLVNAGSELVRISVPGKKHAEHLSEISIQLRKAGINVPLVADIHFNPEIAKIAVRHVAKIRINPGNLYDHANGYFAQNSQEYDRTLANIEREFSKLINICRQYGTVIRIGTNHGSLSGRILARYGNTIEGMVESAMEYARICENIGYKELILSMKASDVTTMINANRLLAERMYNEGMNYPLHLGVTEAGNDTEGRIKSLAGIGTLLSEGIGDTIRVSLTESPVREIPVAKFIVKHYPKNDNRAQENRTTKNRADTNQISGSRTVANTTHLPIIIAGPDIKPEDGKGADFYFRKTDSGKQYLISEGLSEIPLFVRENDIQCADPVFLITSDIKSINTSHTTQKNQRFSERYLIISINTCSDLRRFKKTINDGKLHDSYTGIILKRHYGIKKFNEVILLGATEFFPLISGNLIDGIWMTGEKVTDSELLEISKHIVQISGKRRYMAEYISCPSCARTLFDIEKALTEIKSRTKHLKDFRIAVMGCIVNGPGEMAGSDFGYVGAGPGKIHLYKGDHLIKKNIPENEAVEELIKLISL